MGCKRLRWGRTAAWARAAGEERRREGNSGYARRVSFHDIAKTIFSRTPDFCRDIVLKFAAVEIWS